MIRMMLSFMRIMVQFDHANWDVIKIWGTFRVSVTQYCICVYKIFPAAAAAIPSDIHAGLPLH